MQTPFRLGRIGCGGIVQLQHLPTLLDLNEVQIAALADPITENLAKVASATGVPPDRHYADYRDMLSAVMGKSDLARPTCGAGNWPHRKSSPARIAPGVNMALWTTL